MRKLVVFFLMMVLSFSLLICGCGGKDLTEGMSPREIALESCKAIKNVDSFAFKTETVMSIPNPIKMEMSKMLITTNGVASVEPQAVHLTVDMAFQDEKKSSEVYTITKANGIIQYTNSTDDSKEWVKSEMSLGSEVENNMNAVKSLEIMEKMLEDAEVVDDKRNLVVLEVKIKPEALAEFMSTTSGSVMSLYKAEQMVTLLDIKPRIWVEKETLLPMKVEFDFSELLKEQMKNDYNIPSELQSKIEDAKFYLITRFDDYDRPVYIKVPESVKNNAIEITE